MRTVEDRSSTCLIPEDGLPPLVLSTEPGTGRTLLFCSISSSNFKFVIFKTNGPVLDCLTHFSLKGLYPYHLDESISNLRS